MSSLCGLTFQLKEPTPNKPEKVINIMVDAEGERYINYLQNQLQQKENIIKEVIEYIVEHQCCDGKINVMTKTEFNKLLEILDKVKE